SRRPNPSRRPASRRPRSSRSTSSARNEACMTDVASQEREALTDEAILQRFLRTKNQPTGSQTLGFKMLSVSQAEKTVEGEFEARAALLLSPMKQIQGGYRCAMLDECMSVACMVASGMTHVAPTAEMKTTFFRPAMPGKIRGVGRVARWGSR